MPGNTHAYQGIGLKIHGSLQTNLEAAIESARRYRTRPVYPQTVAHWSDLLAHAWWKLGAESLPDAANLTRLAKELEAELAARASRT
jgi:hypothetical protein